MRTFLNLREYAEHLQIQGNEWAEDILENYDLRETLLDEALDVYSDLRRLHPDSPQVGHYGVKLDDKKEVPIDRVVEWLSDQCALLDEMRDICYQFGQTTDAFKGPENVLQTALETVAHLESVLKQHGLTEGDISDRLEVLSARARIDL